MIRVRAEGEQFLLQADDMGMTVDWIEVSLLYSYFRVFCRMGADEIILVGVPGCC